MDPGGAPSDRAVMRPTAWCLRRDRGAWESVPTQVPRLLSRRHAARPQAPEPLPLPLAGWARLLPAPPAGVAVGVALATAVAAFAHTPPTVRVLALHPTEPGIVAVHADTAGFLVSTAAAGRFEPLCNAHARVLDTGLDRVHLHYTRNGHLLLGSLFHELPYLSVRDRQRRPPRPSGAATVASG